MVQAKKLENKYKELECLADNYASKHPEHVSNKPSEHGMESYIEESNAESNINKCDTTAELSMHKKTDQLASVSSSSLPVMLEKSTNAEINTKDLTKPKDNDHDDLPSADTLIQFDIDQNMLSGEEIRIRQNSDSEVSIDDIKLKSSRGSPIFLPSLHRAAPPPPRTAPPPLPSV